MLNYLELTNYEIELFLAEINKEETNQETQLNMFNRFKYLNRKRLKSPSTLDKCLKKRPNRNPIISLIRAYNKVPNYDFGKFYIEELE